MSYWLYWAHFFLIVVFYLGFVKLAHYLSDQSCSHASAILPITHDNGLYNIYNMRSLSWVTVASILWFVANNESLQSSGVTLPVGKISKKSVFLKENAQFC